MDAQEYAYFVGVDWGCEQHQVCVLNPNGEVVAEWRVAHGGAAVREWCERLGELAPPARLAVAIESPNSPVTEALLEQGVAVFTINPKQLDRFRDRHFPAGSKDDRRDGFVLATSLRTDRACFRRLAAADPALLELRALTRLDETLKADLRAYSSRVRELLLPVFPQLLELSPGADEPWVWGLLEMAPTPRRAARLSHARLAGLLRRHRIRRISAEQLQEQLRRPSLPLPAPSFERAAQQLSLLLPVLRALSAQHAQVRAGIADGIERLKQAESEGGSGQQRDVNILLSLPGVGITIAATLLAEASTALALRDYHALRAHAGVAPVTRQSGKTRTAAMRRCCCLPLRNAVHHMGLASLACDPHAKAHYQRLRAAGCSYGRALRGLADRRLRVLCSMLRSQTLFDPNRSAQAANATSAA